MSTRLQSFRRALDLSVADLARLAGVRPSVICELEQSSGSARQVADVYREKVFAALGNKTRQALPLHKKQELLANSPEVLHRAAYWEKKQEAANYTLKSRSWQ